MNKRIYFVILAIIIALAAYKLWYQSTLITYADLKLTEQQRSLYESRRNQIKESIENFTSKTTRSERSTWYLSLGYSEASLGNLKDAKDAFRKAISIDPHNPLTPTINIELSKVLSDMHDYRAARSAVGEAIEARPEVSDYWLALINLEKDKLNASDEEIKDLYREAIKESSSNIYIMLAYSQYLEQKGDKSGALEQFKAIVKLYPGNKEALDAVKRLQ